MSNALFSSYPVRRVPEGVLCLTACVLTDCMSENGGDGGGGAQSIDAAFQMMPLD